MVSTGFLLVDGNDTLKRARAPSRHWAVALVIVIVAQWFMWQGHALCQRLLVAWLSQPGLFGMHESLITSYQVLLELLYLALPTALLAALALYLSARVDRRGARALGLDWMTAPTALVWSAAGLVAALPLMVEIALKEPNLVVLGQAAAVLTPITIVQAGSEEIVFRGVILATLAARYGVGAGLVISSLLFGLWHVSFDLSLTDNVMKFATTFAFGVTAGIVTLHYGNLGPAIALHVVWNVARYLLGGAASWSMDFWPAWQASLYQPITWADIENGAALRSIGAPLLIETLIVLAVCRETVQRLFTGVRAAAAT
ncbi:MAG: lysostaphin resistance A-like protein [Vitreimonas sp.]